MIKTSIRTRVYSTSADRERAVKALRRMGFNYFFRFIDVQGFGLQFGNQDYVFGVSVK